MKTTIDIPDQVLRRAKIVAAREGVTLRAIVSRALEAELKRMDGSGTQRPWLKVFGGLGHLREETARIDALIEEEFERVDEELWR